jgi:hypothetical protein
VQWTQAAQAPRKIFAAGVTKTLCDQTKASPSGQPNKANRDLDTNVLCGWLPHCQGCNGSRADGRSVVPLRKRSVCLLRLPFVDRHTSASD